MKGDNIETEKTLKKNEKLTIQKSCDDMIDYVERFKSLT